MKKERKNLFTESNDEFQKLITSIPKPDRKQIKSVLYSTKYRVHKYYNKKDELIYKRCGECFNVKSVLNYKLVRGSKKFIETLNDGTLYSLVCNECNEENSLKDFLGCSVCKKLFKSEDFSLNQKKPKGGKVYTNVCNYCYPSLNLGTQSFTSKDQDFKTYIKNIPKSIREKIKTIQLTNTNQKRFYDHDDFLVFKSCMECLNTLPIDEFEKRKNIKNTFEKLNSNNNLHSTECKRCREYETKIKFEFKYHRGMDKSKIQGFIDGKELRGNNDLWEDILEEIDKRTIGVKNGSTKGSFDYIRRKIVKEYHIKYHTFNHWLLKLHREKWETFKLKRIKENREIRFLKVLELLEETEGRIGNVFQYPIINKHDISVSEFENTIQDPIYRERYNEKSRELKSFKIPEELSKLFTYSRYNNRVLLNEHNEVLYKYCKNCGEFKTKKEFGSNIRGMGKLNTHCLSCSLELKGVKRKSDELRIKGDFVKGKRIKKRNSMGNVTHRRCNSCDEFKPLRSYSKELSSSICVDCYVELPMIKNNG